MLRHLAGATIQFANVVNYNCHPQENVNKRMTRMVLMMPPGSSLILLRISCNIFADRFNKMKQLKKRVVE